MADASRQAEAAKRKRQAEEAAAAEAKRQQAAAAAAEAKRQAELQKVSCRAMFAGDRVLGHWAWGQLQC